MASETEAPPLEPRSGILSTLQRGLRILEAVAANDGEATAKMLSVENGLKIGTVYHFLRTLQEEGYVVRFPGGRYGLGSRFFSLANTSRMRYSPRPELAEILRTLHGRVGETAYIAGWYGNAIVLQSYVEGKHAVSVRGLEIGYRDNPHARASCKAILAALPEAVAEAYLADYELRPLTATTITDRKALSKQLKETAARGFAVDRNEFNDGVCCIAAAFLDRDSSPVGSFTVAVPAERFESRFQELVDAVVAASRDATRLLARIR